MFEVVRIRIKLHHRLVCKIASFVNFAFVHIHLEIIVVSVVCEIIVVADEYRLLWEVWAESVKFYPEHRVLDRFAAKVTGTVKHRADCLHLCHSAIAARVKLPAFQNVVWKDFICRYIAFFDSEFRVFLCWAFGVCVKNMETVQHVFHFYAVLLCENFSTVKVFVRFHLIVCQETKYDAEKAFLSFRRLFREIKRSIFFFLQVQLAIYYSHPLQVWLGSFRLFIKRLHTLCNFRVLPVFFLCSVTFSHHGRWRGLLWLCKCGNSHKSGKS